MALLKKLVFSSEMFQDSNSVLIFLNLMISDEGMNTGVSGRGISFV